MKRAASSIILCSLLLFCACGSVVEDHGGDHDGTLLVNLDVSVALSDVSDALTRTGTAGYADAANENEKMHTLRIVIVRPDGTVEANRLIDLGAAASLRHEMERFKVFGNERKRIYLFVNEGTTAIDKISNSERELVEFDWNSIEVGRDFPVNAIEELRIRLEDDTEQIEGPLPMSEKHEYFVDEEPEQSCSLFVTRAAVKFTFRIINKSSRSISFDGLTMDKMAREEWYMPRAEYGEPDETGRREITEYEVPAGVGYYVYGKNTPVPDGVTVDAGHETVLNPIYLLEGKYADDADSRNYSMEISVDDITRKHYFPMLTTLPRNTHVVVNITYDEDAKVTCDVDVIPYSEVILDPGFGL